MQENILEGFLDELEKIALTRPGIEWYPEDRPMGENSPMLHRTSESHTYQGWQYIPKKLRGLKQRPHEEDKGRFEGSTNHAQEISDEMTAYFISPRPTGYIRSK